MEPIQLYGILCYMWVAPVVLLGFNLGAELLVPKKKKIIVGSYSFLAIIFELFLFLDINNSFIFYPPTIAGENIIDVSFNQSSPTFFLVVFFLLSALIFNGGGFLYRSIQSSGILRRKFLYLSIGWFIFVLAGALDSLTDPESTLFIVRIVMLSSCWFWYLGLREKNLKPARSIPSKKELEIGEMSPNLTEILSQPKPAKISTEEVTFYREQTICLVCKGKVEGFSYICSNCKALYCEKCAHALANSENACWVCNEAIDKSKPIVKEKTDDNLILKLEDNKKK